MTGDGENDDDLETIGIERRTAPPARGLRITAGSHSVDFERATLVIGRSSNADFVIDDRTVSSFHVEVSSAEGGIEIRDLNSSNGTLYHGARFERALLPAGSAIQIGTSTVKLELAGTVETNEAASFGELTGTSTAMRRMFAMLARLAATELSVLVHGPTGSGKELVARAIHAASRRASGPFVVLDCTSIPPSLAESVLFGHERGAFTGATERQRGVFEAADGGTVFLDEIGEFPRELQPKLLRVLEQRTVARVGSNQPRSVNVRVIAATWRDLRAAINKDRFREDLYHRLAQAYVDIPGLDQRREDIAVLVRHILASLPRDRPCARTIDDEALCELSARNWPGNVRELRNVVERAAWMALGDTITISDLAFERRITEKRAVSAEEIAPFKDAKRDLIDEFERTYLTKLFERTGGNISRAAALAGIERHYVRTLFRKYGLRGSDE